MRWEDEGILLAARPYGEHHAVAHVFTRQHGHAQGLLYGRHKQHHAPGSVVDAVWQARLAEHLGTLTLETRRNLTALLLAAPRRLLLVGSVCRLLHDSLPQANAYPALYERTLKLLSGLPGAADELALAAYAWWERHLLTELGYGLDLSVCALTGTAEDLAFVSPKTGRAACAAAARPYREKLLPLPAFLRDGYPPAALPPLEETRDALALTGHFLGASVYAALGRPLPAARQRLLAAFRKG